ncbi:MAG TPA: hypothetical protein PLQ51_09535 [Smithellaceae bacterium]|nr:hypothetical protein [Smithellaceae bacterium]
MRVLWALFYSGQTSGVKTEVLRPPGMQKETETGSAAAMAGWG